MLYHPHTEQEKKAAFLQQFTADSWYWNKNNPSVKQMHLTHTRQTTHLEV